MFFMTETIAINPSWPVWLQVLVLISGLIPVAWAIYEKIKKGEYKGALNQAVEAIEEHGGDQAKQHVKSNASPKHTQIINNVLKEKGYLDKDGNGEH